LRSGAAACLLRGIGEGSRLGRLLQLLQHTLACCRGSAVILTKEDSAQHWRIVLRSIGVASGSGATHVTTLAAGVVRVAAVLCPRGHRQKHCASRAPLLLLLLLLL